MLRVGNSTGRLLNWPPRWGAHFDPICVNAFLALRPRIEAILRHNSSVDPATAAALQALLAR